MVAVLLTVCPALFAAEIVRVFDESGASEVLLY